MSSSRNVTFSLVVRINRTCDAKYVVTSLFSNPVGRMDDEDSVENTFHWISDSNTVIVCAKVFKIGPGDILDWHLVGVWILATFALGFYLPILAGLEIVSATAPHHYFAPCFQ